MTTGRLAICEYFRSLRDRRRDHLKEHLLIDMVNEPALAQLTEAK